MMMQEGPDTWDEYWDLHGPQDTDTPEQVAEIIERRPLSPLSDREILDRRRETAEEQ